MKMIFKKAVLIALVATLATLGVAVLPFISASAAGNNDPTPPPAQRGQISTERLERVWARQLRIYERLGRTDEFIARIQKLLDRAKANGKDVSAVQAALDVFKAAARDAKPIYEKAGEIINTHQGFDSNGKVTDPAQARATVQALHGKFKEIRDVVREAGQALREAIQAYRAANPRPQGTPTPTTG